MSDVKFTPLAYQQLKKWEKTDKKIYKRIEELIDAIKIKPYTGIGKPEPLKHQFKGYWSRRINKEHRLVYKVTQEDIIVVTCMYHY